MYDNLIKDQSQLIKKKGGGTDGKLDMIDVCCVRDGLRCRDCIYYESSCKHFRERHPGKQPKDLYYTLSEEVNEEDGSDESRL